MSATSVSRGLRDLIAHSFLAFKGSTDTFMANARSEGDRASLILLPASVEALLTEILKSLMVNLNNDEVNRLFGFEGLAGTFSRKIQLAQALGIVDRPTRNRLDQFRELRNAAAHSLVAISYETPAIADAIFSFYPVRLRDIPDSERRSTLELLIRVAFVVLMMRVVYFQTVKTQVNDDLVAILAEWSRAIASEGSEYNVHSWLDNYYNRPSNTA